MFERAIQTVTIIEQVRKGNGFDSARASIKYKLESFNKVGDNFLVF